MFRGRCCKVPRPLKFDYEFTRTLARTRRVVARIIVLCLAILYITASCSGERRRGTAHDEGSRTDARIRHEREEEGNATYAVLPLLPVLLFFSSSLPPFFFAALPLFAGPGTYRPARRAKIARLRCPASRSLHLSLCPMNNFIESTKRVIIGVKCLFRILLL